MTSISHVRHIAQSHFLDSPHRREAADSVFPERYSPNSSVSALDWLLDPHGAIFYPLLDTIESSMTEGIVTIIGSPELSTSYQISSQLESDIHGLERLLLQAHKLDERNKSDTNSV